MVIIMKKKILMCIALILMTIVEIFALIHVHEMSTRETLIAVNINFTLVRILEIIIFLLLCLLTVLTTFTTNKKVYSLNNKLYIIFILVMFFLVSFLYLTPGNFINSVIFLIFNNIIRIKAK